MKRSFLAIAVIVIAILAIGGILLANHNNKNSSGANTPANSNNSAGTTNPANSGSTATPQGSASNSQSSQSPADTTSSISISNFAFNPDNTTVKIGTKVTWTNNDTTTHTVTENDSQTGPNSGNIAPGSSYSFTFSQAGTYHYHCMIHPEMTGTVTVTG